MTTRPTPHLKSIPAPTTRPRPAEPAERDSSGSAPKVVAEGVRVAVRPDPSVISGIRPGLHIRGLDRRETPSADWLCTCGHHERARGRNAVIALNARVQTGHCPHRTTEQHRRTAA
ncbi:hypothetical protein [Streptomyces sp. NBC_00102]|uniref:hypothetical protein n=1 Tax=Streptomyces sp. NBC_00102 TaxID=2975652 RepID=UPI0022576FC1|nr:hypothetical protein [Streptomyces sp. NBC_00102]MCX5400053.1 hypothetical protein [Streptomyces sp. NBC_00102]